MNYIGKFISNFRDFYNEINSATLTGAIDVIVIQQPDGSYLCSPFHVRFGKIGVLRSREKVVDIEVNGYPVDIHMKLGESGEAFFVEEVFDENEIPLHLATSPLPEVPDIGEELRKLRLGEYGTEIDQNQDLILKCSNGQSLDAHISTITSEMVQSHQVTPLTKSEHEISTEYSHKKSLVIVKHTELVSITSDNVVDTSAQTCLNTVTHLAERKELTVPSDTQLTIENNCKAKRKKRKRPSTKKRVKSREVIIPNVLLASDKRDIDCVDENSSSHNETDEDHKNIQEDIFQMDNDYVESDEDEGYPCGVHGLSRSVSLPVNCNNSTLSGEWPTRKMSSTFTGEFHPFSDGDVTPQSSPTGSRPPSPKSDTEYENQKQEFANRDNNEPSWGWGQLPNVPRKSSVTRQPNSSQSGLGCNAEDTNKVDSDVAEAEKRSMLGGMLNFMRSTKKYRHMPENEGIYLDSINANALDPEVADLYFPKFRSVSLPCKGGSTTPPLKDEDSESGKGPSLPHSPHSVEGAIGGPSSQDSDTDERHFIYGCYNDVAMSLCGGLPDTEADFPEERFNNSLITYDAFTENPSLLLNPNLVMRIDGKYYNWQTAAPMLVSMTVFQRVLPEKTTNQLINEHMPKKKKSKSYSSWFSWRRSESEKAVGELESAQTSLQAEAATSEIESSLTEVVVDDKIPVTSSSISSETEKINQSDLHLLQSVDIEEELKPEKEVKFDLEPCSNEAESSNVDDGSKDLQVTLTQASTPSSSNQNSPVHNKKEASHAKDELEVPGPYDDTDTKKLSSATELEDLEAGKQQSKDKYKKSLRLSSEQIKSLNLKQGPNEVVFSVTTAYQGTTRCKCDIYLWNYDDKIVISDIDGTITKSDVLGHILPMVGKDWAQFGVARLFTKVKENGYQFLYLSARAIGQARITRDYLRSIRQGEVCLPDGPLLLSPTSLISALHREVIEKKPEEFKISCLKDIQKLYPNFMGNPFYAGFGNKINDTWAYRAVGISVNRIFTINHKGELKLELMQTFQSSYTRLSDQADHMFPPLNSSRKINGLLAPSFTASEEFSYFTYWREPIRNVSDEDELPE